MKRGYKTIVYDTRLHIEAFRFEGTDRTFPNHFHNYYVIGFIESGIRRLLCKGRKYTLSEGSIVVFNPGDSHSCSQSDGVLYYRCFNISEKTMLKLSRDITGTEYPPMFSQNVIHDNEVSHDLLTLHDMVMNEMCEFEREELFLMLITMLIERYGHISKTSASFRSDELKKACEFIYRHYAEPISLDDICHTAHLSKSALLRAFTEQKGVTPYSYLQNIRIVKAKEMLERGILPSEAALSTGFSDQSHFTNCFTRFIGLPPGMYREIFSEKNIQELHNRNSRQK